MKNTTVKKYYEELDKYFSMIGMIKFQIPDDVEVKREAIFNFYKLLNSIKKNIKEEYRKSIRKNSETKSAFNKVIDRAEEELNAIKKDNKEEEGVYCVGVESISLKQFKIQ